MSTTDRQNTAQLLFACSYAMGFCPAWIVSDSLFAITINGRERYVNYARSPLNSSVAASLAKNKYTTRLILERHRMPNIPFVRSRTQAAARIFLAAHEKIIAKPIMGSGSRDIHIVTDAAQLEELAIGEYILEKYIAGQELRYLVLNGAVVGVYRSDYGTSVAVDRLLRCIAYPEDAWSLQLVADAVGIAEAFDLRFAAVDFLVDNSGRHYVLEVNTMPDLKWFHSPSSGPRIDIARLFLEAAYVVPETSLSAR